MNGLFAVLGRSLRGLRLVEAFAVVMLLAMVLGNYLAKARAGRERADITAVETQIGDEQRRLRLLQAEVAHLEQPERLERLSAAAGLGPTGAKHEGTIEQLPEISRAAMIPDKGQHHGAGVPAPASAPVVIAAAQTAAPHNAAVGAAPGRTGAPQ
jgi:hypothetical protein